MKTPIDDHEVDPQVVAANARTRFSGDDTRTYADLFDEDLDAVAIALNTAAAPYISRGV